MLKWHVAEEQGGRKYQEDRHHVVVGGGGGVGGGDSDDGRQLQRMGPTDENVVVVAAVYDGHGNAAVSSALANEHYGLAPALMQWRLQHGRFPTDEDDDNGSGNGTAEALFNHVDRLLWHLWREKEHQKNNNAKPGKNGRVRGSAGSSSGGSTAIVAALDGAHVTLYNVGDSRAVILDAEDGRIVLETKDHKPSRVDERARIVSKGGVVSARKDVARAASVFTQFGYATSRAFGDFELKKDFNERLVGGGTEKGNDDDREERETAAEPPPTPAPDHDGVMSATPEVYTGELDVTRRHYIVLASDGLWDVVDSEDIGHWVRERRKTEKEKNLGSVGSIDDENGNDGVSSSSSSSLCDTGNLLTQWLMDEAIERETTDNVTVLVLEVGEPRQACLLRMERSVEHLLSRLHDMKTTLRKE